MNKIVRCLFFSSSGLISLFLGTLLLFKYCGKGRQKLVFDEGRLLRRNRGAKIQNRPKKHPASQIEHIKTVNVSFGPDQGGQFILVLGLEGTGHHMCHEIWNRCEHCVGNGHIGELIFQKSPPKGSGIFSENDPEKVKVRNAQLVRKLSEASKQNRGKTIILNTWPQHGSKNGYLSYPYFLGPYRYTRHPSAAHLLHLAQKAGVKLKFLVLVRTAEQMIVSTTVHRTFEEKVTEIKILENMCQVLRYALMEIGKENYGCIDYNKITPESLTHTGNILGFEGQSFKNTVLSIFRESHGHNSSFTPAENDYMKPLEQCANQLKLLCA